jgi:uncharacterized membrane protein (UPF0127 family)
MIIKNKTKNTILAKEVLQPTSFQAQSLGLLAHKKPVAMILNTRFGIHTLFMKFAIDVLILDKTNQIVALKENLKPNDIFIWNPRYNKVLELPTGTIKQTKTQLTDLIEFR